MSLNKKKKVDKKMKIDEVLERWPELGSVLAEKYGFRCVGCPMASQESLEEGARAHGMSDEKIDDLVKDLDCLRNESE